jgi:hypothetical protein
LIDACLKKGLESDAVAILSNLKLQ